MARHNGSNLLPGRKTGPNTNNRSGAYSAQFAKQKEPRGPGSPENLKGASQSLKHPSNSRIGNQAVDQSIRDQSYECRLQPLAPAADQFTGEVISNGVQPQFARLSLVTGLKCSNDNCQSGKCAKCLLALFVRNSQKRKQRIENGTHELSLDEPTPLRKCAFSSKAWYNEGPPSIMQLENTDSEEVIVGRRDNPAQKCHFKRNDLLIVKLKEAKCLLLGVLLQGELFSKLRSFGRTLGNMVHHILVKIHPDSPAVKLLLGTESSIAGHMTAVHDVGLAIWYLGVLIAFGVFLTRTVAFGIRLIIFLATPLKLLLVTLHWISLA